jgi:tripartite-type tricarboxylate transporter receptor subunit TctC
MRYSTAHRYWLWIAATCLAAAAGTACAQAYPSKPVRLFVGFSAGAAPDVIARLMTPTLSQMFGQTWIVENRGGAGGSLATEAVSKSPPDGHTLLMMAAADTMQPALRPKLPYDLERDFAPVTMLVSGMSVMTVHPSVPVKNIRELIALARANPGKLNYGSSGIGSSSHLMGELFNQMANVKMTHVPYKGSAESATATAAGQIEISFPSVASVAPLIDAGKLRAIAVTSSRRAVSFPNLPTVDESGLPGYDRRSWFGVIAPAGLSRDIIAQLNAALGKVVSSAEMVAALNKQGLEPQPGTPEQFAAFIRSEIAQNAKLIKLAGARSE